MSSSMTRGKTASLRNMRMQSRKRINFRLYVADEEINSVIAKNNLMSLCNDLSAGTYAIQIVDVLENARAGFRDRIMVTPTLIVAGLASQRSVLGNLSDTRSVLVKIRGLD